MEKINERTVAKVNYLNGNWKKKGPILFLIVVLIVFSIVSIWGWGFKGFLYLEMKKRTTEIYNNLVIYQNKDFAVNANEETKKIIDNVQKDLTNYYETEGHYVFTNLYEIETIKSSKKMIYAVTQKVNFIDKRTESNGDRISQTTYFIYNIDDKKLVDLLFWVKDRENRLEGYK